MPRWKLARLKQLLAVMLRWTSALLEVVMLSVRWKALQGETPVALRTESTV
jgi:hypothetical protein